MEVLKLRNNISIKTKSIGKAKMILEKLFKSKFTTLLKLYE